ncbi:hypothetical protein BDV96DRAFT_595113 [Lophiotrema nucula]|uniref:Uncharacterized protein n=1 Tax=Lophiotrema nucula TaxID=690887 RepID=A0A6A5ZP88_9PLEO|nr:hypothetical protein BDV96DRAFT_595113 [Lophiotrema nucula]
MYLANILPLLASTLILLTTAVPVDENLPVGVIHDPTKFADVKIDTSNTTSGSTSDDWPPQWAPQAGYVYLIGSATSIATFGSQECITFDNPIRSFVVYKNFTCFWYQYTRGLWGVPSSNEPEHSMAQVLHHTARDAILRLLESMRDNRNNVSQSRTVLAYLQHDRFQRGTATFVWQPLAALVGEPILTGDSLTNKRRQRGNHRNRSLNQKIAVLDDHRLLPRPFAIDRYLYILLPHDYNPRLRIDNMKLFSLLFAAFSVLVIAGPLVMRDDDPPPPRLGESTCGWFEWTFEGEEYPSDHDGCTCTGYSIPLDRYYVDRG